LTIAPNPVSGYCTISLDLPESFNDVRISLHDISGKQLEMIWSGNLNSGHHIINQSFDGYTPGIYYIKMQTNDHVSTQKCILTD